MTYTWQRWIADALRAEGCQVAEDCGDWRNYGRPSSSGAFSPSAVLLHHTGSTASTSNPFPTKSVLINGRPDLQGPLCQVGIDYAGVCHPIAAGRANHAGQAKATGPMPAGDGNAMYIGFEIDYDGTQAMSSKQYAAAVMASSACLKHMGRNESYARGHKETSVTGKWDPGGYNMNTIRADIASQMKGGGGGDDVVTEDDKNDIAEKVWNRWKAYGLDGKATMTYGEVMSQTLQASQRINGGTLVIAVCDEVWKRYQVRDHEGNLVPLLTAVQAIYQAIEHTT